MTFLVLVRWLTCRLMRGGDRLIVTESAKTLRIGPRSDLVIVGLARVMVDVVIGGMIGVGVDMLTELCVGVVVATVIVLRRFS